MTIEGGPRGIRWTHAEEANQALLDFLGREQFHVNVTMYSPLKTPESRMTALTAHEQQEIGRANASYKRQEKILA